MEMITIQGPVVLLPAEDYQTLFNRIVGLEDMVRKLAQQLQDLEDVRVMQAAERDDEHGEGRPFEDFVAELETGRFQVET